MGDLAGFDQPRKHPSYAAGMAGERWFIVGGDPRVEDGVHGLLVDGVGYGHHDGIEFGTVQQFLKATADLHVRSQFLPDAIPGRLAERRGGHDHHPVVLPQGGCEGQPGPAAVTDQANSYYGHDTPFYWLCLETLPPAHATGCSAEISFDDDHFTITKCFEQYLLLDKVLDSFVHQLRLGMV